MLLALYRQTAGSVPISAQLITHALQRYWASAPYHLGLDLMETAGMCWQADESDRAALIEAIEAIPQPQHPFLSTVIVEALQSLGALDAAEREHAEVIREEVRQFLANPDGHESCTAAYRTYYAQFDHPLSAAYDEVVADLSGAERKQLLMMAGKGWDSSSYFLSPLIIDLASFCDPEAGAIINRWTKLPLTDSFMPQDAIGVFVVAHIVLGRLGCSLPERQTEPDKPSAESLAACGVILYWSNRTDLDEDARCSPCRQSLSVLARHELGAAVDAIRHCEHALVEGVKHLPGQGLVQGSIVNCFPVEIAEICRQALKSSTGLIGYFSHFDRRQVLDFCIQVLGNHGNSADLMLLRRFGSDPGLGTNAIEAVKMLEDRSISAS